MPPKKKVAALVKVALNAGAATPAPPVGTALGPHGVNIMEFCKAYNAATEPMRGNVIPVEITIYEDRSFTFITKTPPAAELIKKAAGIQKGSGVPQRNKVGKISRDQVREIATTKLPDLNANDVDAAMKIVEGTARSHGRHGCPTDLAPLGRDLRSNRRFVGSVKRKRVSPNAPADSAARRSVVGRVAERLLRRLTTESQQLDHLGGPRAARRTRTGERNQTMKRSKNYNAAAATIDEEKLYSPVEALTLAKSGSKAKFDETVDVSFRLGVDPRKADQMVRGTVNLPNGTGKTARVLVFATGDRAAAAEAAGADEVGSDELIEKVLGGYLDFDAVVATPDLMGKVGRLGRVLGPRGLMPNPKTGTVTVDVAKAVSDIKGGKIEFRVDRHANLHFIVGKTSFTTEQLAQNYFAALDEVLRLKPSASKGRYLKKATISTTMGPGVPVDPNKTKPEAE